MATYFVSASGSNTAPYDTWAKAATSLQTALTAATANGDIVALQYNNVPAADKEITSAAAGTWTFAGNASLISASNDGGSAYTPTPMGTAYWLGNSTASWQVAFAGGFACYIYGVTLRTAGGSGIKITLAGSDNAYHTMEQCYLWQGVTSTSTGAVINMGSNASWNNLLILRDCKLRFSHANNSFTIDNGHVVFEKTDLAPESVAPSTLITHGTTRAPSGGVFHGCDFSAVTGTLIGASSAAVSEYFFRQCKLGSGVVPLGTQTVTNPSSIKGVHILDCASADQHYHYEFHNTLGSLVTETGIYANDGAKYDGTNGCSWKIVTSPNANRNAPFVTPWLTKYNAALSAMTPYLEVLRDGSATAYTDGQLWVELSAKTTAGSTEAGIYQDRRPLGGTADPQDAGMGLAGWTGEGGTAWSGKLQALSAFTPQEIGDIAARIAFAEPSSTVYVDPTIRGT